MNWLKVAPRLPGWYWFRHGKLGRVREVGAIPTIVRLERHDALDHGLLVIEPPELAFDGGATFALEQCHGEWAGPLEPPL